MSMPSCRRDYIVAVCDEAARTREAQKGKRPRTFVVSPLRLNAFLPGNPPGWGAVVQTGPAFQCHVAVYLQDSSVAELKTGCLTTTSSTTFWQLLCAWYERKERPTSALSYSLACLN